jgi:hypothetical protein
VISKREEAEERAAAKPRPPQPRGGAAVKVSIPVRVGGYTGQRDAWEEIQRDYTVSIVDESIVLIDYTSSVQRKIELPREGLESALKIVTEYA